MNTMTDGGDDGRVISARWIIPVSDEPINGGWIRICNGRIAEIEKGRAPRDSQDLGDVALLPGLVNAHTHLEFSSFREPIGEPGLPLATWIGQVVAARADAAVGSTQTAILSGVEELAASGTVLAGEIMTPPCEYPSATEQNPELVCFAEVLGLGRQRFEERIEAAKSHVASDRNGAISPHAPYSTSLDAIDACVTLAQKSGCPLAMHVAESPDERELLSAGTGRLADALHRLGAWRDGLFPWGNDAIETLIDRLAMAPRVLLIHGNDLTGREVERLREFEHITVVYCPRTHDYFGYPPHPVDQLLAAGVRVALGTDSRASNPDLNVWKELQFLLERRPDVAPAEVLKMATMSGATSMGRNNMGRLAVGCRSDIGFVSTAATTVEGVYEDFCRHDYESFIRC